MMNGRVSMEYLMIGKPLKRLSGWIAVSDHPNEFGCCPNCISNEFEAAPRLIGVASVSLLLPMRTVLTVYQKDTLCN